MNSPTSVLICLLLAILWVAFAFAIGRTKSRGTAIADCLISTAMALLFDAVLVWRVSFEIVPMTPFDVMLITQWYIAIVAIQIVCLVMIFMPISFYFLTKKLIGFD